MIFQLLFIKCSSLVKSQHRTEQNRTEQQQQKDPSTWRTKRAGRQKALLGGWGLRCGNEDETGNQEDTGFMALVTGGGLCQSEFNQKS